VKAVSETTPEELAPILLEELRKHNVVLEAPPGWGKTRLAAILVELADSIAVVTRTHAEIDEVLGFTPSVIPVYGKEKLCLIKNSDESIYSFCRRMRMFKLCRYKYVACNKLIRYIAGRKPDIHNIRKYAEKIGVCPYPSVLTLARNKKIVTTYGMYYVNPSITENKKIIVFDEAHAMLDKLEELVVKIDEQYIESLVALLKKNNETRPVAYYIRSAWRKSKTFGEFIRYIERVECEALNELINKYYSDKLYWRGKEAYYLPGKTLQIRETGQLFMSAYLPPFFIHLVPNHYKVVIPADYQIEAEIDTDLTSKYTERNPDTYKAYADKIKQYYREDIATLIVFPSHEFKEKVLQHLPDTLKNKALPPEAIKDAKPGNIIVDAAGGKASEGVNPSPHLEQVIVAGLPYPQPSGPLNLLAKIYGFDAVYTYKALLRTIQAIGRLRNKGKAILIDKRYKTIKHLLPTYIKTT